MLITLGRTPECQGIQTQQASGVFKQALQMCADYSLVSQRAVALMFDIATQGGSISSLIRAQIMADFAHLPPNDPANEVARMCIVANRRAAASDPKFVDDVRTRKLTIANGTGTVQGRSPGLRLTSRSAPRSRMLPSLMCPPNTVASELPRPSL
jgi:hypothetical protein